MNSVSLPQWTTEISDGVVTGEDMLGLEGAAQSYQQELIPGIISTTDHARYYSFYAWILYRFINSSTSSRLLRNFRGKFFRRHEVALILGTFGHHFGGELIRGLVGAGTNYRKVRAWWDASDPISLYVNYFHNKLGGLGQYYLTAMQVMGILSYSENPSWVFPLTTRGRDLAIAYENSVSKTKFFKNLDNDPELDSLSQKDSLSFGKVGCLCPEALSMGDDLPLLREAFFRFDQKGDDNLHVRRRIALGVALDMVRAAKGKFQWNMLRSALYLNEFSPGLVYQPSSGLEDWPFRWKMVEVRHFYTFALQALWAAFILRLRERNEGMALSEFLTWARETITKTRFDAPISDYLDSSCKTVGLRPNWTKFHSEFGSACLQRTQSDEFTLYLAARDNRTNAEYLLMAGVQILLQHYLRFLHIYQNPRKEWMELASREKLSINSYFAFTEPNLQENSSLGKWLELLYKEFILGQHEFIALEKMRYQRYDTFKFHFREGRFYWPFSRSDYWREPIRLAGNRLGNALSILVDLGLVLENDQRRLSLTRDGKEILTKVIEMRTHGN